MASAAATETETETIDPKLCEEIALINKEYFHALGRNDPMKGDWWESTGPAIINMYTAYLLNPRLVERCGTIIGRQTANSRAASLFNLILQFQDNNQGPNSAITLMSLSRQGRNLIEILKQQKEGIEALMPARSKTLARKRTDMTGNPNKRGRGGMSGGAMSGSTKKALANIILAGALVTGVGAAIKYGGMKMLTSALVEWLSPAFQDNSHCLTVFGYWKNAMSSTAGLSKSCSMIASENASAADWVVTKVQLSMTTLGISAGLGIWGAWTAAQNKVITFIINPIDNFMSTPETSKSIVSKILSAQVALSVVKTYNAGDLGYKTALRAGKTTPVSDEAPHIQLFFNKPISDALTTDDATKIPDDLDVIVVLPGATRPAGAVDELKLPPNYRSAFFDAIDATAAGAAGAAAVTTGAAAASSGAASTGGKKKRKTMKKKHNKKRNKKHARKTGKKKMHKKKGKKTAKKHHKKHNKKHYKKRGRKTRKH